ncbi:MAG: undecaprenyl-diphosphate phosphatase [Candidatus Micrarchaeota archaeon]
MDALNALLLGMLQGLAEWLPISSKSQVMLAAMGLFGIPPEGALQLSIYLHIGTMLAAIIYFRNTLLEVLNAARKNPRDPLFSFLMISTISTGALGLPLFLFMKDSFLLGGDIFAGVIGVGLIITGLVLLKSKEGGKRREKDATFKDALIAGGAQGFAVLPGISRSGVTTASLLWAGFSQESALKLSFLMSILAVAGAEIGFSLIEGFPNIGVNEGILMTASSFVFGMASIGLLLRVARTISFTSFCLFMGTLSLVPLAYSLIS